MVMTRELMVEALLDYPGRPQPQLDPMRVDLTETYALMDALTP